MKIIKVKRDTSTFVHFFLQIFRKINFKNICSTHYSDNTVLVSSEDTSAPTVRENLEYILSRCYTYYDVIHIITL